MFPPTTVLQMSVASLDPQARKPDAFISPSLLLTPTHIHTVTLFQVDPVVCVPKILLGSSSLVCAYRDCGFCS